MHKPASSLTFCHLGASADSNPLGFGTRPRRFKLFKSPNPSHLYSNAGPITCEFICQASDNPDGYYLEGPFHLFHSQPSLGADQFLATVIP